jgi:hypothetical protein
MGTRRYRTTRPPWPQVAVRSGEVPSGLTMTLAGTWCAPGSGRRLDHFVSFVERFVKYLAWRAQAPCSPAVTQTVREASTEGPMS